MENKILPYILVMASCPTIVILNLKVCATGDDKYMIHIIWQILTVQTFVLYLVTEEHIKGDNAILSVQIFVIYLVTYKGRYLQYRYLFFSAWLRIKGDTYSTDTYSTDICYLPSYILTVQIFILTVQIFILTVQIFILTVQIFVIYLILTVQIFILTVQIFVIYLVTYKGREVMQCDLFTYLILDTYSTDICYLPNTYSTDICYLPSYRGPCKANITRYYFNNSTKTCEKFMFGGCHSNGNNFVTEKDCNTVCVERKIGNIEDVFIPQCTKDGSFAYKQCHGAVCFCVNDNGNYQPGTIQVGHTDCQTNTSVPVCDNGKKPVVCTSACVGNKCPANRDAICFTDPCNDCKTTFKDWFNKDVTCEEGSVCDGNGVTMCVNSCNGQMCRRNPDAICQIDPCTCQISYIDPVTGLTEDCQAIDKRPKSLCEVRRANEMKKRLLKDKISSGVLQCDHTTGKFVKQQCNTTHCWCVDGTGLKTSDERIVKQLGTDIGCVDNDTLSAVVNMKFSGYNFLYYYDLVYNGNPDAFIWGIYRKLLEVTVNLFMLMPLDECLPVYVMSSDDCLPVYVDVFRLRQEVRKGEFQFVYDNKTIVADPTDVYVSFTFAAPYVNTEDSGTRNPPPTDPSQAITTTIIVVVVVVIAVIIIIVVVVIIKRRGIVTKIITKDYELNKTESI
ncbi:hypothetical protein KUTeg_021732 [Tegillarca granosa]|uniref:Uncharacterized protein n=1 Tax=Tegillarca granosa TaxID=220873 RepID=A0ABQ9E479_TEGGR|nr:hypothetical protein KUTeg_021732 [Tegillarca granosa]